MVLFSRDGGLICSKYTQLHLVYVRKEIFKLLNLMTLSTDNIILMENTKNIKFIKGVV